MDCLEIEDAEFDKLSPKMQLKVIYVNVKAIAGIKRVQKMQWIWLGACWTSLIGFAAWTINKLIK